MTKNISEPTPDRRVTNIEFRTRQLERRPAITPPSAATLHIKLFGDDQLVTVSSSAPRFVEAVSEDMHGMVLTNVETYVSTVSSSGLITVRIVEGASAAIGANMLSTPVRIDAGERNSKDATTPYVIDTANDDLTWGNEIGILVDAAGTNARGLGIHLEFRMP